MSFDLTGFVLRAPRTAPSNFTTTDEASNGVDRDFKPLSDDYAIPAPEFVEIAADQYRAAVLLRGLDGQTEYLVWAANSANLSDSASFEVENEGSVTFPQGDTIVTDEDSEFGASGSNRAIVVDDANRTVDMLTSLVVRRGDTGEDLELVDGGDFNPVSGVFTVTDEDLLTALGGGLSAPRGDRAREVKYELAAPTFWWSRNDRYENRFLWDGRTQRWRPLRGTPPRDLGALLQDEDYVLSPAPSTITVGNYLPGNSAEPDSYSMVRIGTRPDAASVPVAEPVAASGFGGIKVVNDEEVEDYDFGAEPMLAGVVGQATGSVAWNPAFLDEYAGQTVFYSYRSFVDQAEVEPLGSLEDADLRPLFLSPIPGPTEYPFVRIGSRQALEVVFADTEALLSTTTVEEGQVGLAFSTGRLKFSDADVAKADPDDPGFDENYLSAQVFYEGVSLTQRPVPMRRPVEIVGKGGSPTVVDGKDNSLYIPDAQPTPSPGVSGILHLPDGTGTIPNTSTDAGIRAGEGSGLVRALEGPWDVLLFTESGQIRTIRTFDDDDEVPRFRFRIPRGTAYVDLRKGSGGSEIILGNQDLKRFHGEQMYFVQSGVQPSAFAREARMYSRVRDEFVLEGDEVLVFRIGGSTSTWDASADPGGIPTSAGGAFTPEDIAASLDAAAATGSVVAVGGRLVLQTDTTSNQAHYGEIEIGFGPGGEKNLSGPAALGLLPGWKIRIAGPSEVDPPPDLTWLPDNGTVLGVFRSPFNLNGTRDDISDVRHLGRFDDAVMLGSIPESPIVLLDRAPLEDVAGYDDGIFFRIEDGLVSRDLDNFEEIYHEFGIDRFSWVHDDTQNSTLEQPANSLFVGQTNVIPDSFRLPGKGLRVSDGGQPLEDQTLDEDFLMLDGGAPGVAALIDTVGALVQLGGAGTFSSGTTTFTDDSPDVDFVVLGVKAGYQLKVTQGNAEGTYVVAQDATQTNTLEVEQRFPADGGPVPWELYDGVTREEFDLGLVADAQYVPFSSLPDETFRVRVLSPLGDVPVDQDAQYAQRLVAVLGDALASGRTISVRFGREPQNQEASMVALGQENLGEIANSALTVPDPGSERFANDNFSIRVGTKTYSFAAGDLIKVSGALTYPLVGDVIEVQEGSGLLNFGTEVFTQFDGQDAVYVEEFLTPNSSPQELPPSKVEYRASDGELNFSAVDMQNYGGVEAYLVEQLVATNGTDVTLNPIQGSLLLTKALREFQIVEVHYFQAETGTGSLRLESVDPDDPSQGTQPVEITEQLPLFVRLEEATPEEPNATDRWKFNPTERTVDEDVEPALYVGSTLYNVGSSPTATFDLPNSVAILENAVADTSEVLVTYAVFEAFGGEQSYTVSTPPVYRPPFRIEAGRTRFTLETDRTEDLFVGQLLRVGEFPFYVTAVSYDSGTNQTTVDFTPQTDVEVGSRDPASDSLSLVSDVPLATDLAPEAPDGFWAEVVVPYEPVNRGFNQIIFHADLTAVAVTGHLLELGGLPFIVAAASLSGDGSRTAVDLTSFFPRGFAFGQDAAKISVRPVYQPQPTSFIGRGAVLPDAPFELILFGERDGAGNLLPGKTLRPSIDYELNTDDGAVEFLDPPKGPLLPTQSLYLRHTRQRSVAPIVSGDILLNPRFVAKFVYVSTPSEEDNRLGKILRATYSFANPDTFFYRTLPLLDYLGEVSDEVAQDIAAQLPSFGPAPAVIPPTENADQGRLGLKSQLRDLQDTDRAARVFLQFYNEAIVGFEQVQETISGNIVGDRDGKFRFHVGRGSDVPPPGYEDAITGELNERNLFSEVFFGYNPKVTFLVRDPLVDPTNFVLAGDQLEGAFIDPDFLGDLQGLQRGFSTNDVDDVVLVSRTRKRLRIRPLRLEAFGRYKRLGEPSRYSRIFPERAELFTLTDPGIQADLEADPVDPGVYAFRKKVRRLSIKGDGGRLKIQLPKRASTFLKPIADIGNPVLGQVENVGSVSARVRLPRARIFAYSRTGFPELDHLMVGFPTFASQPRPAVIATPLPLHEFPLGEDGLPDVAQFVANGGDVIDLTTGDPDLFTPPFAETDAASNFRPKITFGRPDGRIIDVQTSEVVTFEFPPSGGTLTPVAYTVAKSVFVGEVILGCIITFAEETHDAGDTATLITSDENLLEVSEDPAAAAGPIDLSRGDTVFVTPSDAEVVPAANIDDPSTNSEKQAQLEGLTSYRIGFDLGVDRPDGEFRDITFSSFSDPSFFGIKEILGQSPPKPLSYLEGHVTFRSGRTEPAPIPALVGGFTNDSGDYTLPYLYAQNTEIDQLGIVQGLFTDVLADTAIPSAAFPDEVQGTDGEIVGVLTGSLLPAALNTSLDATPVTTAGGYTPLSGVGDVVPFDVLLIETGQTAKGLPAGSQGILSVGYVRGSASESLVEPPRFVSPTAPPAAAADRIRYKFRSAMGFVNQAVLEQPPGVVARIVGTVTQFDITAISTGILVFNDGSPGLLSGGLNDIFSPPFVGAHNNVVTINLWTAASNANPVPVFLQSVVIDFGAGTVTGNLGASVINSVTADDNVIYVDTVAPFLSIGFAGPPELPADPTTPGDSLPLWFTVDIDLTVGGGVGTGASTTGFISSDRLTLDESFDLRAVLPRDEPAVAGVPVFSELDVAFVRSESVQDCTVNAMAEVNGGTPFTFVARSDFAPKVGTFDPAPAGSGRGTVRVMGFEGHGNTPITTTGDVVFSAIPSSAYATGSAVKIAEGTGVGGVGTDRDFRISSDGVTSLAATTGALGDIRPADVLSISSSASGFASTKAGTYLVKHVIEPNASATQTRELMMRTTTLPYNTGRGWAAVDFPTLVSADLSVANEVVLSRTLLESDGTTSAFDPTGGTLYFVVRPDPDDPDYGTRNLKVDYTSVNTASNLFQVDRTTATDFAGSALPLQTFVDAIEALPDTTIVTGFYRFDVLMDRVGLKFAGPPYVLPLLEVPENLPRNVVGFDSGITTAAGFSHVFVRGQGMGSGGFGVSYGGGDLVLDVPPAADELAVYRATPIANTAFVNDENAYVYQDVPQYVEMNLTQVTWDLVHANSAAGVGALLPGDSLTTSDGVLTVGFVAQAGIFLEPSWPRPTLDLAGANERIVDAAHSVPAGAIGFRNETLFGEPGPVEAVGWEVRRVRRFHEELEAVGELLGPLRYVYETRSGVVTGYGEDQVGPDLVDYPFVVIASAGTNLGPFNDELVNVNPGDTFRLLDDDGTLLDEVEIGGVQSGTQIWLKEPGITAISAGDVPGKTFEVYLRQVPVPHTQSNEQLLGQVTTTVLLDRKADVSLQEGGEVPVQAEPTDPRVLEDTDKSIDFAGLGIEEGDIVIVDPAGDLTGKFGAVPTTGQERGVRAFGDRSVPGRTTATTGQEAPFVAGAPSELDDNRGWYRVTQVSEDQMVVSSQTEFSADPGGGFVTFGVDAEYAVLPTISSSTAAFADPPGGPGVEGQMDLRPTAFAGTLGSPPNSFLGNGFSIAPFSYKVIRPNTLFSDEAIDLVLLMRERTLSFLEEFDVFFSESKHGSYFVFQRDEHVADLGNPLIPDEGKGVMSNELIDGVRGLVAISPFANTTDCLSVLDRRFWVNDYRLDSEFPPGSPPAVPSYSTLETNANNPAADEGDGRPVLPDRIDDVLDNNDQFRELRLAWLDFRVNREDGTLEEIERFVAALPKKRREEIQQLRLSQSVEDAGT